MYKAYDKINGEPVTAERAETLLTQLLASESGRAVKWDGIKTKHAVDVVCNECGNVHAWRPNEEGEYCEKCGSPNVSFDIEVSDDWPKHRWRSDEAKDWWEDAKERRGWEKIAPVDDWPRPWDKVPELPWPNYEEIKKPKPKKKARKKVAPKDKPAPEPKPDAPVIRRRIRWQ